MNYKDLKRFRSAMNGYAFSLDIMKWLSILDVSEKYVLPTMENTENGLIEFKYFFTDVNLVFRLDEDARGSYEIYAKGVIAKSGEFSSELLTKQQMADTIVNELQKYLK